MVQMTPHGSRLPADESVERIETPGSASNRSGAHRFGLQYPPRPKHGARFVGGWSRDEGAKIEPKLDNVKFRELLQGATDARPADPEARRKRRLTNPAAGADMFGDDAAGEEREHFFFGRFRPAARLGDNRVRSPVQLVAHRSCSDFVRIR